MRILIFCTNTRTFGAEIVTLNLIKGLLGRGDQIGVLGSTWTDGEFGRRLSELGLEARLIPLGRFCFPRNFETFKWCAAAVAWWPVAAWRFLGYASKFKPDAIIFTSLHQILRN